MSKIEVNELAVRTGTNITFNNTVEIDTIKGKTTAGSISVQGEGTNTTNLQQGLAKSWISYRGTSTVEIRDSLNVGSLTDNSTGDYTITFTNNMGNNLYPVTMASDHDAGSHFTTACIDHDNPNPVVTTQYVANYLDQTNNMRDTVYCHEAVHGDLA
tara:strand:+ start:412 stop:882 length:471 start_codon:yes stop_codon:yes gene_type:complete